MSYLLGYLLLLVLFVFAWLTYIPRCSFIHYLRNIDTNLVRGWTLYKIKSNTKYINYFILLNTSLDEVVMFEHDIINKDLYIKDRRIRTYQEQKILKEMIQEEYSEDNLNRSKELDEEKLEEIKEKYKKSYYFISSYDFEAEPVLKI